MRLVLDTNVLVAAFVARGACAELAETALTEHQVFVSEVLLDEFRRVLIEKFQIDPAVVLQAADLLQSRCRMVAPELPQPPWCRDPDDDHIPGTAAAGRCHCIVTGDQDLLVMAHYRDIAIVSPRQFWNFAAEILPEPEDPVT